MNRRSSIVALSFLLSLSLPLAAKTKPAAPLTERLVSQDASVRADAIQEFHRLPRDTQEEFVPSLMVALTDDDPGVRDSASSLLKELGHIGGAPAPEIQAAGESEKRAAREHDRKAALQEIEKSKKDSFPDLQQEVDQEKEAKDEINPSDLKPSHPGTGTASALLEGLKDSDPWVRARAARKLGLLRPAPVEALPDLTRMLDDPNPESRASAAGAIGSMGPAAQSAAPALLQHMNDPDPGVRQILATALRSIQPSK